MAYIPIPDSAVSANAILSEGLFERLRDNPEAVWAGDPSAPLVAYPAHEIAGTGADGAAVAMPGSIGVYDYTTVAIPAGVATAPNGSIIRATTSFSMPNVTLGFSLVPLGSDSVEVGLQPFVGLGVQELSPGASTDGASYGDGGDTRVVIPGGATIKSLGLNQSNGPWRSAKMTMPAAAVQDLASGPVAYVAGCLTIICAGDVDLSGATINANGPNASADFLSNTGGGGGIIKIYALGTVNVTGLTINVGGGNAAAASPGYEIGGGGGGYFSVVAPNIIGAPTLNAGGGAGAGGGVAGSGGVGAADLVTAPVGVVSSIWGLR